MDTAEAGKELARMYSEFPEGEKTTAVRLFGVRYAAVLASLNLKEVVEVSGLRPSMKDEVWKGLKLAKYVEEKQS